MAKLMRVTSEVNSCDCCGKKNLLFTAVIQFGTKRAPRVMYYGSECAEKALGFSVQSRREWVRNDK